MSSAASTARRRQSERKRGRERERESETDSYSAHSLTGECRADQPRACRADQCTSASAQPSHRSSLPSPLPCYDGQGRREEEDQGYAAPMEEIERGQPLYDCPSCRAANTD
jgi:hypothetical protein